MSGSRRAAPQAAASLPATLNRQWRELCSRYLPVAPPGSIWRYSRESVAGDPEQGWKLHISATVLTVNSVLEAVAPLLMQRCTQFKAPVSLEELNRLNSGIYYGYSQVGKVITVYPQSAAEAVMLAERLHELTRTLSAPSVPFEQMFQPDSCVFYRYGSFLPLEIENADGTRTLAVRDPDGNLVPDRRDSTEKPEWVCDLFPVRWENNSAGESAGSPFRTTYRVLKALVQRGKGGVYQALDLSVFPPRFCVIKEGRRDGETDWEGRDGRWRVRHEEQVLNSLQAAGVESPRVLSSFEAENNFYLVTEHVEGTTLQAFLRSRTRRFTIAQVLRYSAELAAVVSRIHSAGWTWRDCKPPNIMLTKRGALRPLDFEGACPSDRPDPHTWGTPGYVPPEWHRNFNDESREPEDLYALGTIIYLLLVGVLPASAHPLPVEKLRRGIPAPLRNTVLALLDPEPRARPRAAEVARLLGAALPESRTKRLDDCCHARQEAGTVE